MSDADNQMGGSGGETGRKPGGENRAPASEKARTETERNEPEGDEVTETSEQSFPASDPPSNY